MHNKILKSLLKFNPYKHIVCACVHVCVCACVYACVYVCACVRVWE